MAPRTELDLVRLLDTCSLPDLAQRAGAELKRSGGEWRGACPLHGGDNKSAFVVTVNGHQRWRCWTGCNAGGDALDFIREWKHLSSDAAGFIEAVQVAADFAGLSLDQLGYDPEQAREIAAERAAQRQRADVLDVAARYYGEQLHAPDGDAARTYAEGRGWTAETLRAFLGASDGRLLAHLRRGGADLSAATAAGLLKTLDDGRLVDSLPAGYLVYIHRAGHVTYLSGRAVASDEPARKARNLPGAKQLFWARERRSGPLLVVEGQADALTAWQWGYPAVALCGSALSDGKALAGFQAVYLLLDSDVDGAKRAKVADALGGLAMLVPPLPDGHKDLNAWLQAGGSREALAAHLVKARPWIEQAIEEAASAPAYELETQLDRLARLVAPLTTALQARYSRAICEQHKLTTPKAFRQLLTTLGGAAGESNGFEVVDNVLHHYGEPLGNFAAAITHELIRDDGMNPPSIQFTLKGTLDTGEVLDPIELPAEEFGKSSWLLQHWGARPILHLPPGKMYLVQRAIQEVSRRGLQRERVYTHTGWTTINGQRHYLTAAGGLGPDGLQADVRVELGHNLGRYHLPAPPADPVPALRASLGFLDLASYDVTMPLWAAMFAAPLSALHTLDAVLWVYGTTQSGKSTLSHLALCHFGAGFIQGRQSRAPKDWTSTVTDLEGAMFAIKDAPIILDDYAPAHSGASEARDLAKKAHYVVRSVGNRSARGRSRADLTAQTLRPPRGLVIATAEQPLIGQSIVGRMVYVQVPPGSLLASTNGQATPLDAAQRQAQGGQYAAAMAGYVAWLAGQWETLAATLPEQIEELSRNARGLLPATQSRLADYYGIFAAALDLALRYAREQGAIGEAEEERLGNAGCEALLTLLQHQGEEVADQSPVHKFWIAVSDLLAQEKVYFASKRGGGNSTPIQAARIGMYDEQCLYLHLNPALIEAKKYWDGVGEHFDTLPHALARQIDQQGYIQVRDKDGKRRTTNDRLPGEGSTTRLLALDLARLCREYDLTGIPCPAADAAPAISGH